MLFIWVTSKPNASTMLPAVHELINISKINQLINVQVPSGHACVKNSWVRSPSDINFIQFLAVPPLIYQWHLVHHTRQRYTLSQMSKHWTSNEPLHFQWDACILPSVNFSRSIIPCKHPKSKRQTPSGGYIVSREAELWSDNPNFNMRIFRENLCWLES